MAEEKPVLELHQRRAFTSVEQGELLQLWRRRAWPNGGGRLYSTTWGLYYGFGGFLVLSVWMAVNRLLPTEPQMAGQLMIAAMGFALALVLSQWVGTRLWQMMYWQALSPNDRYELGADGIRRISTKGESHLRWRGIDHLVSTDRYVAMVSGGGAMLFAKAAFAGQDVDGFCTELERRWRAARVQSA